MTQTLYFTSPNNPSYQQILITSNLLNRSLTTQQINNKYPALNLVTNQGILNQPISILIYLSNDKLQGQTQSQKSLIYQWFEYINMQFIPLFNEINGQINQLKTNNKQKYQYSLRQIIRVLDIFNTHLKLKTVFIGNSITLVDISLATYLDIIFKKVINQQARRKLSNLTRWFNFVRSIPPFLKVLGPIQFCQKDQEFKIEIQKIEDQKDNKDGQKVVNKQ